MIENEVTLLCREHRWVKERVEAEEFDFRQFLGVRLGRG